MENSKLKDYISEYYFDQNYNCAETILRASNEYYGFNLHEKDMIMVGAYGGGMQTGNTCGAILAAAAVLSLKYVESKAHESESIKPVMEKMISKVNEKYGSLLCADIKHQEFMPEIRCKRTVETVCDILEETIKEYEAEKI